MKPGSSLNQVMAYTPGPWLAQLGSSERPENVAFKNIIVGSHVRSRWLCWTIGPWVAVGPRPRVRGRAQRFGGRVPQGWWPRPVARGPTLSSFGCVSVRRLFVVVGKPRPRPVGVDAGLGKWVFGGVRGPPTL